MNGFLRWLRDLFGSPQRRTSNGQPAGSEASRAFTADHNEASLLLYRELVEGGGNLLFSPFSVRAALGLIYAGAGGETAAEMSRALHFPVRGENLHGLFAGIMERLNRADGGEYEVAVASSLWTREGVPLQQGFVELARQYYHGSLNIVDFQRDAEAARQEINYWVEEKTRRTIRELIPTGGVGPLTRLLLVNAIYFKGVWVRKFSEAATFHASFFLEDGSRIKVPLMNQHDKIWYARADGFQVVDLDYQGDDLSMLLLLPDRRDGLSALEQRLCARLLDDCIAMTRLRKVRLYLPRFKMSWGAVDLAGGLCALGMPSAFDDASADFSGINAHRPPHEDALSISSVLHRAFVEVNEEGTKAAAVTAVQIVSKGGLRFPGRTDPVFRADHPFLFAIRDRRESTILFLGRLMNPAREC